MKFVDTLSERRSSFLIGGMDSDIEELLRSAGGSVLEPHRDDAPAEALVVFVFQPRDPAAAAAVDLCRLHGWAADALEPAGCSLVAVPATKAARVLEMLGRRGQRPHAIRVRAAELLPAQVEGIRRAAGPDCVIEVDGVAIATSSAPKAASRRPENSARKQNSSR